MKGEEREREKEQKQRSKGVSKQRKKVAIIIFVITLMIMIIITEIIIQLRCLPQSVSGIEVHSPRCHTHRCALCGLVATEIPGIGGDAVTPTPVPQPVCVIVLCFINVILI